MAQHEGNGWSEWQRKVLSDIERLDRSVERNTEQISELRSDVKSLRTLAGFIGSLAGAATGLMASLFSRVK